MSVYEVLAAIGAGTIAGLVLAALAGYLWLCYGDDDIGFPL